MSNWLTDLINYIDSVIALYKKDLILIGVILPMIWTMKNNLVICICVLNREKSSSTKSFGFINDELSDSIKPIISKDTKCFTVLCEDFSAKSLNAENILSFHEFHVFHCFVVLWWVFLPTWLITIY